MWLGRVTVCSGSSGVNVVVLSQFHWPTTQSLSQLRTAPPGTALIAHLARVEGRREGDCPHQV